MTLFSQGLAAAQSARAGEPAGYRALITEAVAEYDAGNFAEARSLFHKANSLHANARALRGLGMSEFELRNYGASASFLEQALASKVQSLEGDLRAETLRLLARARGFIAHFDLVIEPPSATVVVDGVVQLGPQPQLVLEVGDHLLEVSAPGRQPEKRVLKIQGGEQQVLRILLPEEHPKPAPLQVQLQPPPLNAAPAAATQADTGAPAGKPLYKNPWLWAGVGVAVVAVAVGLGVGLSRSDPGDAAPIARDPTASLVGP